MIGDSISRSSILCIMGGGVCAVGTSLRRKRCMMSMLWWRVDLGFFFAFFVALLCICFSLSLSLGLLFFCIVLFWLSLSHSFVVICRFVVIRHFVVVSRRLRPASIAPLEYTSLRSSEEVWRDLHGFPDKSADIVQDKLI